MAALFTRWMETPVWLALSALSLLGLPTAAQAQMACEQLTGMNIPASAIGLPTTGASLTYGLTVAPSGSGAAAVPEHCEVYGTIKPVDPSAPSIAFKVALPTVWNRKAILMGGGGFNGAIPNVKGNVANGAADQPLPLARGYATFASDSGHQAVLLGAAEGYWALNDEAVQNFIGDALKKTRDVAVEVMKARYGQAPMRSYVIGGSTGGREALTSIQRWPADWDGAVAWYPAWNDMMALVSGVRVTRALAKPGAYIPGSKRALIQNAALERCDALDGVKDGLISNQARCNQVFDPMTAKVAGKPLRCPGGLDTGDTCLSNPQILALRAMNAPTRLRYAVASGETGYPGFNVWGSDLGITTRSSSTQTTVNQLALNLTAPATVMSPTAPFISYFVDQAFKYMVTRDATFDTVGFDPEAPGPWVERISALSKGLDTSTDLSGFKARGGKLLMAHGHSDVLVSTRATADYYQRLQKQYGVAATHAFVRYHEIAGFGHAVSSDFNATWDALAALDAWVEQGVAPDKQITTDTVGVPGRTRPLCDHPLWPKYRGVGDVNAAASFACVK